MYMFSEWNTQKIWEVFPLTVEKWNKSNGNVFDLYPMKTKNPPKNQNEMREIFYVLTLMTIIWKEEGWKEWKYNIPIISWLKPVMDSMELEKPALIRKKRLYLISSISPEILVNLSICILLIQYKELAALFG